MLKNCILIAKSFNQAKINSQMFLFFNLIFFKKSLT